MLNHLPSDCEPSFHVYCVRMRIYFEKATDMWDLLDRFCDPNNILISGFEFVDEFKNIQSNNLLCNSHDFVSQSLNPIHNDHDDHIIDIALQTLSQHTSKHKPTKKRSKYSE
jgi:hypothetical protein